MTPTFTATRTPTTTDTLSPTHSFTATSTETFTTTWTDTYTSTHTGTATPTLTATVTPTQTDTATSTNTGTPTHTSTGAVPCSTSVVLGETGSGSSLLAGQGYLFANKISLSQAATIYHLSIRLYNAVGNVEVAVYTDISGSPASPVAVSASQAVIEGWNTISLSSPAFLTPGDYWLAIQVDGATTGVWVTGAPAGTLRFNSLPYGAFPDPFPGISSDAYQISLNAIGCPDASFITYTPTVTLTYTVTSTPTPTPPCYPYNTVGEAGPSSYFVPFTGILYASPINLSAAATIFSLSIELKDVVSGDVAMAVYDDSSGVPTNLRVASPPQPAVEGWNTLYVTQTRLDVGNYWLAVQAENAYPKAMPTPTAGTLYWVYRTYDPLFPNPFPTGNPDSYQLLTTSWNCPE